MSQKNNRYSVLILPESFRSLNVSGLTLIYTVLLLGISIFAREIFNHAVSLAGRAFIVNVIWIIFVGFAFVVARRAWALSAGRIWYTLCVIGLGVIYAATFEIFEERIHLVKYGLLALFLCRDLEDSKPLLTIPVALMMVLLVACADETVQYFTPGRVGDVRDVLFDVIGGIWGVTLSRGLRVTRL